MRLLWAGIVMAKPLRGLRDEERGWQYVKLRPERMRTEHTRTHTLRYRLCSDERKRESCCASTVGTRGIERGLHNLAGRSMR